MNDNTQSAAEVASAPVPVHYTWDSTALVSDPPGASIRIEPRNTDLTTCVADCTITFADETPMRLTVHEPPDANLDEEARGICAAVYWSRMRALQGGVGDYSREPDPRGEPTHE